MPSTQAQGYLIASVFQLSFDVGRAVRNPTIEIDEPGKATAWQTRSSSASSSLILYGASAARQLAMASLFQWLRTPGAAKYWIFVA